MIDVRQLPAITGGDCVAWLQSLPTESVASCVSDPPYCSGDWQESKSVRRISSGQDEGERRWFMADSMGTAGLTWLLRAVCIELHRVLVPGGHAFLFAAWRPALILAPALESSGLRLQNWVVWDKRHGGNGEHLRRQHETILHYAKGVARRCEGAGQWGDVLSCSRVHHTQREHPTEKPIELLDKLIRVSSWPGDVVIDPFAGSGATGVAAHLAGRRFAGAEIDSEFADVARRRLGETPIAEHDSRGQLSIGGLGIAAPDAAPDAPEVV